MMQSTLPTVVADQDAAVLQEISEPQIGMAVWARELTTEFGNWLDNLSDDELPDMRILVALEHVPEALEEIFNRSKLPADNFRKLLLQDILELALYFSQIANQKTIDIRLEKIKTDACWKFHFDNVPLRMLTTYKGLTTQWVNPEDEVRALKMQRDYDGVLHALPRHSVAIFKGIQSTDCCGVLHRSPPIEALGESRLLLCFNIPSVVSPGIWKKSKIIS